MQSLQQRLDHPVSAPLGPTTCEDHALYRKRSGTSAFRDHPARRATVAGRPFLNTKWAAAAEARAKALGLAPTPLAIPIQRNFPWQFDAYGRFRNALIDFCLECGDALRDWVQPAMRSQPVDPFGSAHIKVLFGLCGAIIFAEQG